jgi:AAA family ATP:ADP antiporter
VVRTALFAKIDLAVNVITLIGQGFIVAHIIRRIGMGWSLAIVPVVAMGGFLLLGLFPTLAVLVVVQVLYRSLRYAIAKPTREVLFTVVDREEKYKSKAFIDAAVYRGGDLVNGWIYAGLTALGLTVGAIALVAVPVAGLWALTGLQLGRRQEAIAAVESGSDRPATHPPAVPSQGSGE